MSIECTSCGHTIPLGQFRCGKCGAVQTRDSVDDMSDVGELSVDDPLPLLGKAQDSSQPVAYDVAGEPSARDSIVPRGTFASDEPAPPDDAAIDEPLRSADAPDAAPQAMDAVARTSEPPAPALAPAVEGIVPPVTPRVFVATPVSTEVPIVQVPLEPRLGQPPKPPFLASEILHEDLMPTEPGGRALTQTLRLFGGWGLLVALWGLGSTPFALVSVGALALLVTSVLRVPHITRALMVASVSATGLCIACFWKTQAGGALEDALLAASTTLLASALLFRAWYRGSNAARGLVAAGLLTCLSWAAMGVDRRLLLLDWTWQSWLPALIFAVFVILCVLSLLAFMDDETTGACDVWAGCLLVWYAVHSVAREALVAEGAAADEAMSTLGLTEPIFAAPLAVALAQLLARVLGQQHRGAQMLLRRNA